MEGTVTLTPTNPQQLTRPAICPRCGEYVELIPLPRRLGSYAMTDPGVGRLSASQQRILGRHGCSYSRAHPARATRYQPRKAVA